MFNGFRNKVKEKMIQSMVKKLEKKAEKDPKLASKLITFVEIQRKECEKKGLVFDDEGNIIKDPRKKEGKK